MALEEFLPLRAAKLFSWRRCVVRPVDGIPRFLGSIPRPINSKPFPCFLAGLDQGVIATELAESPPSWMLQDFNGYRVTSTKLLWTAIGERRNAESRERSRRGSPSALARRCVSSAN